MRGMRPDWDIFCNVIDNYGDIGIAWRLARALKQADAGTVRLWVDDLYAFRRIWPEIDPHADRQHSAGVEIRAWHTPFAPAEPARRVIEAFGCALPENYLEAMAAQTPPPVWVNLEYLSAESWVATHHGLPSPHPRLPLTRFFFFPGYTPDTGGLPMERDYATRRAAFDAEAWRRALALPPAGTGDIRVSLFAYENPALPALLDAWAGGGEPVTCLVPEGRVLPQLAGWLGTSPLAPGAQHVRGSLRLVVLPFTDQDRYDHLLWACDLNFVRGEDSCVRAQWAGRPMVWQAYPQDAGAHWQKLEALLALYGRDLPMPASEAVADLWRVWNGTPEAPPAGRAWPAWRAARPAIEAHAAVWPVTLAKAGTLADALADFAESRLK
jgi:uncharacterized repeat protein (TIGR03837 family)